ncbi:Oidioi.mRNA.OKI2018_I69.XSR.g15830.t3.cds [Oikopleura dioica]|uniref:Oidioi.mRNA.OKI2018_I69.XSR.g15830.t3.cds n=1 Tax=Oikopleura dioica TaxID=34765 RepID=A0ABN7SJ84_OIKDI|nr:Oidioi.mRNA.OKI2018_I69.XSR.g15830.t3.cds [Oikopleura dioica]
MSTESFGTGVDESLADFEEAERIANSEEHIALALAELDKVDNDVALLQNRSVAGGIYNPQMSSDRYFESEYSGNEVDDADQTLEPQEEDDDDIDEKENHFNEGGIYDSFDGETASENEDDFEKMMDEMVSVVESQTADESDDGKSFLSFNSSRYNIPRSMASRSVVEEERASSITEPYRVAPSVALARPTLPSGRSFELDTSEKPLTRARSTPKLSKSGPNAHAAHSTGNQLGRENKWASMPWLTTRKSVSDFSDISNIDNDNVKTKIKTLKNEKEKQDIAYKILQDDNTNLSKELSIAKQTIDSLRLNPTMNINFPQQQPGAAIAGAIPRSAKVKELPKASSPKLLPSSFATPKLTQAPYKGASNAQLARNKPYLQQADDDDYDYPSPNFGKNHERTVIQATPNRLSYDSHVDKPATDQENRVKANLARTELTDMIDGIDQSMNNYRDLVKMGQIDDSEREGVLENIGRNERKLEEDYMSAKSDVGEKLLDPDGVIGADIIRLGDELGQLKRQQELDAIKSMKKKASAGSVSSNRSSNATTVERNRCESPSRIPVQPAAEKYRRRNSRPSPVASPHLPKNSVSQLPVKKAQPNSSRQSSRKGSLTPQKTRANLVNEAAGHSLADSGIDSRVTSKPMSEIRNSKIPSTRDIIDGRINSLSESLKRNPFDKQRKTEMVPGKSSEEEIFPSERKTTSFGISAAPIMKHSVTQTEKDQPAARQRSHNSQRRTDQPKERLSKYRSTGDIRNLNQSDDEMSVYSESATDAETVVRNRRRQKSPKGRRSLRSSRQNIAAESAPQPPPTEYVYLKEEIDKLKGQLERQKHENEMSIRSAHKPIIRASSGVESSTNFDDSDFETRSSRKTNSIFAKLRKEIKGLREDLYKIATPKNRSRASSVNGETDGNLTDPHEQEHISSPPRRSQSPRRSQTHSIPRSQGVPLMPQPVPAGTAGFQYMPFPVDSQSGMPLWLLPNKSPFAGSTPNLTLIADEAPRSKTKSGRLRVDYTSDTNSDRDRRSSRRGTLLRASSNVQVYDADLDRRLRKVERASTKVDRGSRELMRSAQYKHYGYL